MEKEKIELYATEANELYGTSDSGEKVKRSVYKVRDAATGRYDRVHFETDSKMVWDATYNARADMIARRDSTGSIEFKDILAEGNATVNVDATIKRNLLVNGVSNLTGKLTANGSAEIKNGLTVSSGGVVLAEALTVNGATALNDSVTINNNKLLTLDGGSDLKLTDGSEVIFEDKSMIRFQKDELGAGNGISIGGGARTIVGAGESAAVVEANTTLTNETLHLAADSGIELVTNLNSNNWNTRKRVFIDTNGGVTSDGNLYTKTNLISDGLATLKNGANITGANTSIGENLTVAKTATVTGSANIVGGATISTSLLVSNASATINKNATINENLRVDGISTLVGVVNASSNVNLINGSLNIKNGEFRTGGTENKSIVISAEDESLYLRASKTDSNGGEVRVNKTNIAINKPVSVTGGVEASLDIAGANINAKSGHLRTVKNGLATTLSSESTTTFDINTEAATVRVNKPTIITGNLTSTTEVIAGTNLKSAGNTISRGLVGSNTKIKFEADNSASGFYFNKPIELPSGSAVSPNFNADKVDGCDVNDSSTSSSSLWTANKVNITKADKSISVAAGDGLVGGGDLSANRTISHANPGAVVQKMGLTKLTEVIRMVNVDKFGHIASIETYDMDKTFATPEQVATAVANANTTVKNSFLVHSELNPDGSVKGPAKNTVNNVSMANYEINYSTTGGGCIQFIFS